MRPSSREQSSSRYGDERSPRPARPRLNRETVDRAWESGAPSRHADYRTRSNNGNRGQAPRNNWRDDQQNGQNRQGGQYPTRNNRPSYGDRPGERPASPRRFDHTTHGSQGYQSNQRPPSRPFNADRPDRPNRPYGNSRPSSPEHRDGNRSERGYSRPYEPRPSYRTNEQGGGFQRRNTNYNERTEYNDRDGRSERGPRQFERNNHGNASNYNGRPTRPTQSFDRDRRSPGNSYRDTRSPRDTEAPDTRNPRWQSRPAAQRESSYRREQNDFQSQSGRERYEGDYERFNDTENKPRFAGRPSQRYEKSKPRRLDSKKPRLEVQERHVTPLPDGRVLKGPRPVQRKNAEFWTGIAQNTDELLDGVKEVSTSQAQTTDESAVEQVPSANDSPAVQALPVNDSVVEQALPAKDSGEAQELLSNANLEVEVQEQTVAEEGTPPVKTKPRNRATSAAARSKKASDKQKDTQAKTSGPKPRPSKRGFKWPTPE